MDNQPVARLWRGFTEPGNADAYERLLREEILPGIARVPGYLGARLLRRAMGDEVEFVTLTMFRSLDAVRAFAGPDYETAVIPAVARKLLRRFDSTAAHYEAVFSLDVPG